MNKKISPATACSLLDDMLYGIVESLEPQQVFEYDNLIEWAKDKGVIRDLMEDSTVVAQVAGDFAVDEIFDEDAILSWVLKNKDPEDVFDYKTLSSWALDNGFTNE